MAELGKKTYPYLPTKNWWRLRDRFIKNPPKGSVDADYLATVLGISRGAAGNLVGPLRVIGLIDDELKTPPLAEDWRSNEHYADACHKMIAAVYPQQLRDAQPPPKPDRDATEKWFMRATGAGQSAATRMATFYQLLADANPTVQTEIKTSAPRGEQKTATSKKAAQTTPRTKVIQESSPPPPSDAPSIHVDVQIHIPPDANAEQIDLIFASMAKHFYPKQ